MEIRKNNSCYINLSKQNLIDKHSEKWTNDRLDSAQSINTEQLSLVEEKQESENASLAVV